MARCHTTALVLYVGFFILGHTVGLCLRPDKKVKLTDIRGRTNSAVYKIGNGLPICITMDLKIAQAVPIPVLLAKKSRHVQAGGKAGCRVTEIV